MKKIIAVLSAVLVASTLHVSCADSDGKCNNCGKKAKKVSEQNKTYAEALDIEGEYCADCLAVAGL